MRNVIWDLWDGGLKVGKKLGLGSRGSGMGRRAVRGGGSCHIRDWHVNVKYSRAVLPVDLVRVFGSQRMHVHPESGPMQYAHLPDCIAPYAMHPHSPYLCHMT